MEFLCIVMALFCSASPTAPHHGWRSSSSMFSFHLDVTVRCEIFGHSQYQAACDLHSIPSPTLHTYDDDDYYYHHSMHETLEDDLGYLARTLLFNFVQVL